MKPDAEASPAGKLFPTGDRPWRLDVVSDEIAADPAVALPAARAMGFTHVELNRVGELGIHELDDAGVAELRRMIKAEGLQVVAVAPPAFKVIELDDVPVAAVVDAATGLTRWGCIGSGDVDYAGQIAALRRDGYDGVISVETHWRKPDADGPESTRDTLAGLRSFL